MKVGDYCLAPKYSYGEGWDSWAVGFYVGEIFPGRHQVSDKNGKTRCANGFRRCEPIAREQGDFLIVNKDWIEKVGFKLWDYIHLSNAKIADAMNDLKDGEQIKGFV